jgi:hypothetical protein
MLIKTFLDRHRNHRCPRIALAQAPKLLRVGFGPQSNHSLMLYAMVSVRTHNYNH